MLSKEEGDAAAKEAALAWVPNAMRFLDVVATDDLGSGEDDDAAIVLEDEESEAASAELEPAGIEAVTETEDA